MKFTVSKYIEAYKSGATCVVCTPCIGAKIVVITLLVAVAVLVFGLFALY